MKVITATAAAALAATVLAGAAPAPPSVKFDNLDASLASGIERDKSLAEQLQERSNSSNLAETEDQLVARQFVSKTLEHLAAPQKMLLDLVPVPGASTKEPDLSALTNLTPSRDRIQVVYEKGRSSDPTRTDTDPISTPSRGAGRETLKRQRLDWNSYERLRKQFDILTTLDEQKPRMIILEKFEETERARALAKAHEESGKLWAKNDAQALDRLREERSYVTAHLYDVPDSGKWLAEIGEEIAELEQRRRKGKYVA